MIAGITAKNHSLNLIYVETILSSITSDVEFAISDISVESATFVQETSVIEVLDFVMPEHIQLVFQNIKF